MILITGATGFIGRHLVRYFLENTGMSFYILTRKRNDDSRNNERIHILTDDITQPFDLPTDVTTIYHCAGVISKREEMAAVNIEGTRRVFEVALKINCRVIHLSSAGVTGHTRLHYVDEKTQCRPSNLYEITKWEAEKIVEIYVAAGVKAQIVRPTAVIGPGRDPSQDSLLHLIRSIKNGYYVNIAGGKGIYNIVHVDEVVRGMVALDSDQIPNGGTFLLNTPISYKELAEIVREEAGIDKARVIKSIPRFVAFGAAQLLFLIGLITGKKMPLTNSRLRALTDKRIFRQDNFLMVTGYKPLASIQEHIRKMYYYFSEQGLLDN